MQSSGMLCFVDLWMLPEFSEDILPQPSIHYSKQCKGFTSQSFPYSIPSVFEYSSVTGLSQCLSFSTFGSPLYSSADSLKIKHCNILHCPEIQYIYTHTHTHTYTYIYNVCVYTYIYIYILYRPRGLQV